MDLPANLVVRVDCFMTRWYITGKRLRTPILRHRLYLQQPAPACGLTHGRGATSSSFRGGQFSQNFIRWHQCAYSTVVQLLRKRSHIIIMYFCPQTRSP